MAASALLVREALCYAVEVEVTMREIVQQFNVALEFPVCFTRDLFAVENPALSRVLRRREQQRLQRCLFVLEERVVELWPDLLAKLERHVAAHAQALVMAREPHVIAGGEACKNDPHALGRLHSCFEAARMDRHATVVIVGGGALQDLVGYAAATTHRGVRVARVPTTVLSQADSGVGVKNGINAFGKKNFLGTFAAPHAVLIDPDFLRTLPRRDAIAGMAEAIKVALIKDAAFFAWMVEHAHSLAQLQDHAVAHLVARCAELHLQHIATGGDPFEYGSARPLDFGHWSAHKLETLSAYRLSHGEAVAIGIALDTRYCVETGLLTSHEAEPIFGLLETLGLPLWDAVLERTGEHGLEVLAGLEEFREHLGGELTVTLLERIGRGREVHALETRTIVSSLGWLRARSRRSAGAQASATP
jgi:3-dehydroquinate synthase